ncbi:putative baseplate assembly protein [Anabaena sp. CS-542/02]|uniref:putative baseplate assembly protein n=1 Tax=Anabaena sp. CS-542/02 TaxID=3021719 RepID=UPI00232F9B46|nr:putative baseplate assembly protein [Anabaena sp. CS-542/02]MDB9447526.1 putative baseplate assembly protein [Anabaena sp. CS-542/02]
MSIPPPKIDQRSYEDLVEQTQALVKQYTDKDFNKSDAGLALMRIFSRMATVVSDRLNRVPDRNLLAFLNLIGTQQTPPQPARVPLTFSLAGRSPVDALVPAHTQISAPPLENEKEEVIFETEQDLLVTGTKLQAMFVIEDRDYYSDRTENTIPANVQQNQPFLAFTGHQPVEHYLYINCEEIFQIPELTTATITIHTDSPHGAIKLQALLDIWFYWDAKQWQTLTNVQTQAEAAQLIITLTQLPKLMPAEINGQKAKWLKVALIPHNRQNLPEITQINFSININHTQTPKLCLFNTSSVDLSKEFYPFGATPLRNDTFSIPLANEYIKPGVAIIIDVKLSHEPTYTQDLEIIWEIGNGQEWQIIETTTNENQFRWYNNSSPIKFIENSTSSTFQFPQNLPELAENQEENYYWIRARITNGIYGRKGRERKYVVYNDVTLVAQNITSGQSEIYVDSVDELEIDNIIRLQTSGGEILQEEIKIIGKVEAQRKLILENTTRNAYTAGSRVLSKFTMAENTPDTFDPPVVESVNITYTVALEKPAFYYAYNDFIYCEGTPVLVRLSQAAQPGETIIHLDDVSPFKIGEFLKFDDNHPEKQQIELIDGDRNLVIFTKPLNYHHQRAARVIRCFHPLTPQLNRHSALYLGFNQPFPHRPSTLYLQIEPPKQEEVLPNANRGTTDINLQRIAWEYPSPKGWKPLIVQDETQAFVEKGLIQFIGPTDFIPSPYFGKPLYWLRARKQPNNWENLPFSLIYIFHWALGFQRLRLYGLMRYLFQQLALSADFTVPPRLRSVRTNTVWASQTITLENEILGSSNNDPKQVFTTTHSPILLGQKLEIQEGKIPPDDERRIIAQASGNIAPVIDETGRLVEVWIPWEEVPDFYSSTPKDRHYVLDRQTGKIYFGDGQAGMIPPRGRNNIRLSKYCTGGGIKGNRAPQTIAELKTTIPYIDSVINWEAATGGNEQESLDKLKERSPKRLRHRNRAVTAQDFEDLVYEASIDIARVKIITPEMMFPDYNPLLEELWLEPDGTSKAALQENHIKVFNHEIRAGRVLAIIVPYGEERQPTPTLALLNRVRNYLQARFVPTITLLVSGPKWQEIRVITEIVPVAVENADAVKLAVSDRIHSFLHPLTGGDQGKGWSFGRKPHHSDLYAVLEKVPGVKYVRALDIQPVDAVIDIQTMIYSGQHIVTLKLPGDT